MNLKNGILEQLTYQQKKIKLKEISGTVPSLSQVTLGCPFCPRCSVAETRCKVEKPKLKKMSQSHSVSCWLH